MGHSNSLKDVPNVNSKEFEKFLKDNGFSNSFTKYATANDKLAVNKDYILNVEKPMNSHKEEVTVDQTESESIGNRLFKIVDNWSANNPGISLIAILGLSTFICYKITIGVISQAVFKGNIKTSRYFDKHAG